MAWVVLVLSGMLEAVWATALAKSEGFSKLAPRIISFVAVGASMMGMAWAMRTLPVGTAYAVWGAIGAIGTIIAGILLCKEPVTFWRMFFLTTLVISVVGLQVVSNH